MEFSKFKISNNIVHLRCLHGLSQSELARIIGVSKNAISDYETGKYNPSLKTAILLSYVFNCTVEEIFFVKLIDKQEKI